MDLDLVDGRDNSSFLEKVLDVASAKVGDADGLHLAKLLGGLKSAPAGKSLLFVIRGRVNEIKVKIV